ncbi:Dolichol-phosphate mannosyltransferase [Pleurostoma richardsiae]|uniref:Dolichol-phosphate mannosyltransferase n=1 Tax=Pleurostoma richardsiae TaxID=41990 RepID=A0AA38VUY1_9PEZI|nr:Dolichol-phosphate mannosyltransferase [Pleurostoma richardsiae]
MSHSDPPFLVTVHPYPSPTPRSYAYELGAPSSARRNALVFIGGLGDGPHTVPYIRSIAKKLEAAADLSYSVFEIRLTSSFAGFGFSSLKKDVQEISALVKYLRSIGKQKVVLMGHSTGCQDCVEYADENYQNEPVDGSIMQGTVSDKEAISKIMSKEEQEASVAFAAQLIASGRANDIMPRDKLPSDFTTPVTAYRWHSLAGVGGDDDFFSSDLPDEKLAAVWGRFSKPVLILPSAEDEHVPKSIDVEKMIGKWKTFCAPGIASELSGLIPGASHTVPQSESQKWISEQVAAFLQQLEK